MGSSNSTDNRLTTYFERETFYFKDDENLPICKRCFFCRRDRFSVDEIKILSNKDSLYNF